jgi:LuxR family maltose regulon positive regulatory protein
MAFKNEPVNSFQSIYKTSSDQSQKFSVSCITVHNQSEDKMLLHICRPENNSTQTVNIKPPAKATVANPPETLSQREIEVLRLLAAKVSTQDIANTLSISIRTVRTHIQHLMYKLQVHKRAEAIQAGKRLNLIS